MEKKSDIELINELSRKKLTEEDVYIFPVTLCDNEIDRDFESFSVEALNELSELFVGKTGISDHSMRSCDQTARVFRTWIEQDAARTTKRGEKYTCLKAKAYMVRTLRNEDFIREIEAGIKKEVSVSCSVAKHTCSICGKEICSHIRGRKYDSKLCYTLLSEATDAYEWSFVAVPAQREAGVTKTFKKKEREMKNTADIIKSAFADSEERKTVCDFIDTLEKEACDGREYREELLNETKKLLAVSVPQLSPAASAVICGALSTDSLKELRDGLVQMGKAFFPSEPQTRRKGTENNNQSHNDYMI